ncbi:MAG: hypothetical protein L6R39_003693 [Caloplaca ligustica]|nr:MAG: hypothetical protein L6R39_003693 [Caloplaca ligustica]
MCFFDQHRFACGDWKWGHFRQHCNREYRTGETCGMKLIMQTVPVSQKCKLCDKIDTKQRRRSAEEDRIARWKREGSKFRASIDRSYDLIKSLDREIYDLRNELKGRFLDVAREKKYYDAQDVHDNMVWKLAMAK